MGGKGKEAAQRLLAIIVIISMMTAMNIPIPVIVFFAIVIYFVWRAVQHTERQETNRVFDFYVSANDILRDEERRWYGFEVAAVTNEGERILREMPDAPPLVLYALGALYHRIGDDAGAREHLTRLVETEAGDENSRLAGSPELRRYVEILRRIERDPTDKPQTMAALRSLERARRQHARTMLDEARGRDLSAPPASHPSAEFIAADSPAPLFGSHSAARPSAPMPLRGHEAHDFRAHATSSSGTNPRGGWTPEDASSDDGANLAATKAGDEPRSSITDVLRDVYEEEKRTA